MRCFIADMLFFCLEWRFLSFLFCCLLSRLILFVQNGIDFQDVFTKQHFSPQQSVLDISHVLQQLFPWNWRLLADLSEDLFVELDRVLSQLVLSQLIDHLLPFITQFLKRQFLQLIDGYEQEGKKDGLLLIEAARLWRSIRLPVLLCHALDRDHCLHWQEAELNSFQESWAYSDLSLASTEDECLLSWGLFEGLLLFRQLNEVQWLELARSRLSLRWWTRCLIRVSLRFGHVLGENGQWDCSMAQGNAAADLQSGLQLHGDWVVQSVVGEYLTHWLDNYKVCDSASNL